MKNATCSIESTFSDDKSMLYSFNHDINVTDITNL